MPIFYIWHKKNEYFGLISNRFVAEGWLDYVIATIVFTGISYLFLKNLRRAAFLGGFFIVFIFILGKFSRLPEIISSLIYYIVHRSCSISSDYRNLDSYLAKEEKTITNQNRPFFKFIVGVFNFS
ncbi:MAG: hypothetical protein NVV59_05710 [Chitinophagaceae bacterium]|nr:hypothetical protein [Chitinophagaceae bacterium]